MARVSPRLIELDVDGVDRSDEVSKARITSGAADSDFLTFSEARGAGSRQYRLSFTCAQDHASDTLWDIIWTAAGTEIDGVYAPYGNAVPSAGQPHYEFTAVVSEPDGDLMGADANRSTTAVATIDVVWDLTAKPAKVVAP
jgi:hypothetical protein